MRMRRKKHRVERIVACGDLLIHNPIGYRSRWNELFGGDTLSLEIGCGKGGFACGMARRHPETLFLAVEKSPDVLLLAMERAKSEGLTNLRFIQDDAALLSDAFEEGEVERIFLNFSDPWPKAGHEKRRLSSPIYIELYKKLLPQGGRVIMKTDNTGLFDYSLSSFKANGFEVTEVTRDLHSSQYASDNIMTEYEALFSSKSIRINRAVFIKGGM
ncbi:MAG: tRNA (guanosine(46)-N7)-methyltransferase TrmB [Eubacteriales bacterium]